jgi:GT2 family glycosyltransferase
MMAKEPCRVALVVVNWNGWRDTLDCLESIYQLDYPDYLAVLVDNGSTDDSLRRVRQWLNNNRLGGAVRCIVYTAAEAEQGGEPSQEKILSGLPSPRRIVLIETGKNVGFAEGNNVAFRYIFRSAWHPDFIFILNNDATIAKECLRLAVSVAERTRAGVVGARILDSEGRRVLFSGDPRRPEFFFLKIRGRQETSREYVPSFQALGSGMLIRRDAFLSHERRYGHFFNPLFFMYGEETEFCLHLLRLGYRIIISRKAVVFHKESQSVSTIDRKPMQLYYMSRNTIGIAKSSLSAGWRIFFHLVYLPLRLRLAFRYLLQGNRKYAEAIWEGVWDGYRGRLGKWRRHPQKRQSI